MWWQRKQAKPSPALLGPGGMTEVLAPTLEEKINPNIIKTDSHSPRKGRAHHTALEEKQQLEEREQQEPWEADCVIAIVQLSLVPKGECGCLVCTVCTDWQGTEIVIQT